MTMENQAEAHTETRAPKRGRRNEVIGEVISDKMDKTISVLVYRLVKHKRYGKFIRRTSVFKAHDEKRLAKMGDRVKIYETRPISRTKHWRLCEVVHKTHKGG